MKLGKVLLILLGYAVAAILLLLAVLYAARALGAGEGTITLVAALGGALVASLGPLVTALVTGLGQSRDTDERIRDEASRVALDLTRMDFDLRLQALSAADTQQFLAPAKVYREFYKAIVELRTEGTWPQAIEDLGLLNVFELHRPEPRIRDLG